MRRAFDQVSPLVEGALTRGSAVREQVGEGWRGARIKRIGRRRGTGLGIGVVDEAAVQGQAEQAVHLCTPRLQQLAGRMSIGVNVH